MRRIFLSAFLAVFASPAFHAEPLRLDPVTVKAEFGTKAVRITGAPELVGPARTAFQSHGGFRVVDSGSAFTINFTPAGANQVKVDVSTGSGPVFSQTASGASTRNALFRAADLAVEKILPGTRGFFAGKLTFVSEASGKREVCTSDLFLGDAFQVTTDRSDAMHPRWSADGARIIYTSFFRSGTPDVFVVDTRTRQRQSFASFKGTNSGGRFSPDGSTVAVVLSPKGNSDIYLASANGTGFRPLTRTPGVESSPVFSPEGSRLLFASDQSGPPQLYMMPVAGGTMTRVQTNISGYCAEPDWSSAKPNKIVFTARVGGGFQVAVYDLSTREGKIVTRGPGDVIEASWLADGRHVICTVRSAGVRRLAILDTEWAGPSPKLTTLNAPRLGNIQQANYWKR